MHACSVLNVRLGTSSCSKSKNWHEMLVLWTPLSACSVVNSVSEVVHLIHWRSQETLVCSMLRSCCSVGPRTTAANGCHLGFVSAVWRFQEVKFSFHYISPRSQTRAAFFLFRRRQGDCMDHASPNMSQVYLLNLMNRIHIFGGGSLTCLCSGDYAALVMGCPS